MENLAHVVYFDEWGKRMDRNDLAKLEKAYVLLAKAEWNYKMQNSTVLISPDDLKLAEKSWVNQIKMDSSFHFETTEKIYGLGYGPKYSI